MLFAVDLGSHRNRKGAVAVFAFGALRSVFALAFVAEFGWVVPVAVCPHCIPAVFAGFVVPLGFSGYFTSFAKSRLVVPVFADVDGRAAILAGLVVPFGIIGRLALFAEPWSIPVFEDVDLMSAFRGVSRVPPSHRKPRLYSTPIPDPNAVAVERAHR